MAQAAPPRRREGHRACSPLLCSGPFEPLRQFILQPVKFPSISAALCLARHPCENAGGLVRGTP